MCALENAMFSSEDVLTQAKESLQVLLRTTKPAPSEVSVAVESLERLKSRLGDARRARIALREETVRATEAASSITADTERIDRNIIDAKLQAGELLSERDRVARDLARARQKLARLDESVKEMQEAKNRGEESSGDEMSEREEEVRRGRIAKSELERLKSAEKELAEVTGQLGQVRKRREDLKEKLRMAQEEW